MRRVASKFVPRLLSVDQKQQRLDVFLDLTTPAFFLMSLRVTKPGFTPTTQKPKLNPVNGKVRGHLNRRRQGKWEATSNQCWFVSLIRRELFTQNFFLLVKELMLHSTSKFGMSTGECEKEATWSVAEQHVAAPPWQCASPCCPPDSTVFDRKQHDCGATSSLLARPCTQRLFSYFQNWKWSLRGEDFRCSRKFKQSRRLFWTRYEKMTSRNASKTGSAAGIVVKPQKGATLKVMPAPNV